MHISERSVALRKELSSLISPLRRVRVRVPFWKIGAHRVPTLWSLYRGLLRNAPTEAIKGRVKHIFRENQHLTGTQATTSMLLKGYKWTDVFDSAKRGDERTIAILGRYDRLIVARRKRLEWESMLVKELEWQKRLRNRPMLTGSLLRGTVYNKPMPRLKPQPLAISMMIKRRRAARDRRGQNLAALNEWLDDIRMESQFEQRLMQHNKGAFEPVYDSLDWEGSLIAVRRRYHRGFELDTQRSQTPISKSLYEALKQARRDKIANKTRERERERRGEILPCTVIRRNKRPPAHLLSRLTSEQRRMDAVVRSSASEVGYVGKMKKRLGWRLKDEEAWKVEGGWEEGKKKEWLDAEVKRIEEENRRRRDDIGSELSVS